MKQTIESKGTEFLIISLKIVKLKLSGTLFIEFTKLGLLARFTKYVVIFQVFSFSLICVAQVQHDNGLITIGHQIWMTENLNVERFRNGDLIHQAKTDYEWNIAAEKGKPAWCFYNNDPSNGLKYGKLYNWYAVNDPRGLAPDGFHIPTDEEWFELTDFLTYRVGVEGSGEGWQIFTKIDGFHALRGGWRGENGVFEGLLDFACWWSATEIQPTIRYENLENAWCRVLGSSTNEAWRSGAYKKKEGLSVRCIRSDLNYVEKDYNVLSGLGEEHNRENANSKMYDTAGNVKIGDQVWMVQNLDVDKFRNGDLIPQAQTNEEWERAAKNKQPAWCYYDQNISNAENYGKLYNWYAVSDPRGLAPQGYHIPSIDEWSRLSEYMGGINVAGGKLKGTSKWQGNGNGSNISGFSGWPGGYRHWDTKFGLMGIIGCWWSSSVNNNGLSGIEAWAKTLSAFDVKFESTSSALSQGLSVRCIKDK